MALPVDSNQQSSPCYGLAQAARAVKLVRPVGFEPTPVGLKGRCATITPRAEKQKYIGVRSRI